MHANNILLEGYSGGNDFFTGASYVAESPSVYLERIRNLNGTLSDGHLSVALLSLGASPQLRETKGVGSIIHLMSSNIESKDIVGTFGFESVKVLFRLDSSRVPMILSLTPAATLLRRTY